MSRELVLGADIGGTSTRMVLADLRGRIVGSARGSSGNPKAVGQAVAAAQIRDVLARCLADSYADSYADSDADSDADSSAAAAAAIGPDRIRAAVLGLAGLSGLGDLPTFIDQALPGVDGSVVRVLPDFAVAFASATPEPSGYVVLAGTGAGAMQIVDGAPAGRRDAWGWLLGDEGSGFWLGREAVRATLVELQRGQPPGALGRDVLHRTGSTDFDSLIAAAYDHPPIRLAELAPAVSANVSRDRSAARIAERAAALLMASLTDLHPVPGQMVVTVGSILGPDSPVRRGLVQAIAGELDNPVRSASDGLAGALWLAYRDLAHHGRGDADTDVLDINTDFHAALVAETLRATPS